ncbi:hypothetical protein NIES298_16460 [Microcystis aeruginosa NIES-298]|nr:hypothetical protein NIES298_16460 [Microcystis aeruginosa NIES-298]
MGVKNCSDIPLIKGGLRGDRYPPYQGGQGGSKDKIYLQFN